MTKNPKSSNLAEKLSKQLKSTLSSKPTTRSAALGQTQENKCAGRVRTDPTRVRPIETVPASVATRTEIRTCSPARTLRSRQI